LAVGRIEDYGLKVAITKLKEIPRYLKGDTKYLLV
jgi:hypothetical protein